MRLTTRPASSSTLDQLAALVAERAQVRADGDRHYADLCAARSRLVDLDRTIDMHLARLADQMRHRT